MQQSTHTLPLDRAYNSRNVSPKPSIMPPLYPLLGRLTRGMLVLLLILHCLMIVLGPAAIDLSRFGQLGHILYHYGEAAGTNSQYAFFSPGISIQIRVRFTIKKHDEPPQQVYLLSAENREANLRLGDISDQFLSIADIKDPVALKLRRKLAASLASHVFRSHPDARSIVVYIDEFMPKPLRAKEPYPKPQWRQVSSIEFSLRKLGVKT